jgi:hypothetical protein
MARVTKITRTDRADRADWVPLLNKGRYQLVSRSIPYPGRNRVANATFVNTLDEAGDLIERDYAIRMAPPGASRGDYIYPENLKLDRT